MAIDHISDTARWVAAFRAQESERADALFSDPFARALAGPRGLELARTMRWPDAVAWNMAVRTRVLDEWILEAAHAERVDVVLNLAAGLDTRPQRLPLPPTLRWIEADHPEILAHKARTLADTPSRCALERVSVDLADDAARSALLTRVGAEARRALVLTEGLLVYLPEALVAELARSLSAQPGFAFWMLDLVDRRVVPALRLIWNGQLATGGAQMQFGVTGGARWFAPMGWRLRRLRSFADEGARLRRGALPRLWGKVSWAVPGRLHGLVRTESGPCWLERDRRSRP